MQGAHFSKAKLKAYLEQDRYRLDPNVWQGIRELHIDLNDALHVLRRGAICGDPEFDARSEQWRFTVEGITVDDKQLRIGFAFIEIDGVLVLNFLAN